MGFGKTGPEKQEAEAVRLWQGAGARYLKIQEAWPSLQTPHRRPTAPLASLLEYAREPPEREQHSPAWALSAGGRSTVKTTTMGLQELGRIEHLKCASSVLIVSRASSHPRLTTLRSIMSFSGWPI